ncbi:hypothetical protein ACU8KH_06636 [Lachancea thermotolerans]
MTASGIALLTSQLTRVDTLFTYQIFKSLVLVVFDVDKISTNLPRW